MSHNLVNINKNMDKYIKIMFKIIIIIIIIIVTSKKHHFGSIMFCKSLISARARFFTKNESLGSASKARHHLHHYYKQ